MTRSAFTPPVAAPPEPHAAAHDIAAAVAAWRCSACGGVAGRVLHKRGYAYAQCVVCRLAQRVPMPDLTETAPLFEAAYFEGGHDAGYDDYVAGATHHRHNANARLDQLQAAGVRRGELLELGSAAGFLLRAAEERGFRVTGVDVSSWSRKEAASRSSARMHASLDDVARPATGFDAVVLLQVLEHVPDAPEILRRLASLAAPDGLLLIETWDVESGIARRAGRGWQQLAPPSVLWLFGRSSLTQLLECAGWRLLRIETPGKVVALGVPLHQVLSRCGAPGRWLFALLARTGITRWRLRYRGKDLITVLARRA